MIFMKMLAAMALSKKQNKCLIFEKHTGATVNDILPDDEANEAFKKIDGNITGVDWEVEIKEPVAYMPQLNKNQYAELAGEGTLKKITPELQEWRTTAKSQECDTAQKLQECTEITRAQDQ